MADDKLKNLSAGDKPVSAGKKTTPEQTQKETGKTEETPIVPWSKFIESATESEIKARFAQETQQILSEYSGEQHANYCFLALLDPDSSIGPYDLDQIYRALTELNANHDKDVFLMLLSRGGSIEPAYQISKLCKSFAKQRFVVAVPRQAKSAATLIAIGADEIHMGPLGQLGPIDPQLGGLPALGVSQALKSIASLSEQYPKSSDMFARYLHMVLTVEQIGYCERISESAVQYAERLLLTKPNLSKTAATIAKELVHEYKDHGFVIDLDEARQHLGSDWIRSETPEIAVAEKIYRLFETTNLYLGVYRSKRLLMVDQFDTGLLIFDKRK